MNKCNIDELKSVLSSLSSLESKLNNLDIGKSERSPVDLSELSDVVENNVKNTEYVELVKKINNNKTIDTSDSVKKATRNLCCCYTRFSKYLIIIMINLLLLKLIAGSFATRLKQVKFSKQK